MITKMALVLKRSDHFLGTLKFYYTVSVSSSDSLVKVFVVCFINEINCKINYSKY
jgi:hypothetical protein